MLTASALMTELTKAFNPFLTGATWSVVLEIALSTVLDDRGTCRSGCGSAGGAGLPGTGLPFASASLSGPSPRLTRLRAAFRFGLLRRGCGCSGRCGGRNGGRLVLIGQGRSDGNLFRDRLGWDACSGDEGVQDAIGQILATALARKVDTEREIAVWYTL